MRTSLSPLLLALALPPALGACASDFLPANRLEDLRLLVVRADPAEPSPGQSVTLTPLWYDAQGRTPSFTWGLCPSGSTIVGNTRVSPDCVDPSVTLDGGATGVTPLGDTERLTFTIPTSVAQIVAQSPPDTTNGVYVPVRLVARAGADQLVGVYRVRVHLTIPGGDSTGSDPPNQNPAIARIVTVAPVDGGVPDAAARFLPAEDAGADGGVADGGAPAGAASGLDGTTEIVDGTPTPITSAGLTLRALLVDGSDQAYHEITTTPSADQKPGCTTLGTSMSGGSSVTLYRCPTLERLSVRWYVTAGKLENPITGLDFPDTRLSFAAGKDSKSDQQNYPVPPSGTLIDVYAVATDARNGANWLHRRLIVQ